MTRFPWEGVKEAVPCTVGLAIVAVSVTRTGVSVDVGGRGASVSVADWEGKLVGMEVAVLLGVGVELGRAMVGEARGAWMFGLGGTAFEGIRLDTLQLTRSRLEEINERITE